jgi:hypothetical protein
MNFLLGFPRIEELSRSPRQPEVDGCSYAHRATMPLLQVGGCPDKCRSEPRSPDGAALLRQGILYVAGRIFGRLPRTKVHLYEHCKPLAPAAKLRANFVADRWSPPTTVLPNLSQMLVPRAARPSICFRLIPQQSRLARHKPTNLRWNYFETIRDIPRGNLWPSTTAPCRND